MEETLEILQDNLGQALIDTAYMVVVSAIIGVVLGTLVALLLYLTENRLFTPNHALNVVPVDVLVDQDKHLVAGAFLPMLGIDGLRLHATEESLRGGVVGAAALRAH